MGTFEEIIENNLKAIAEIKEMGSRPFGQKYVRSGSIKQYCDDYEEGKSVSICGRITAIRDHGKTKFFDLKDISGKIQLYLKKGVYKEEKFELLKKLTVGDFIGD